MFAVCYKLQFRVIVIYSSLFIVVIYVVFFWKLHQQHEASITDNHTETQEQLRAPWRESWRTQTSAWSDSCTCTLYRLEFFTDKALLPPWRHSRNMHHVHLEENLWETAWQGDFELLQINPRVFV